MDSLQLDGMQGIGKLWKWLTKLASLQWPLWRIDMWYVSTGSARRQSAQTCCAQTHLYSVRATLRPRCVVTVVFVRPNAGQRWSSVKWKGKWGKMNVSYLVAALAILPKRSYQIAADMFAMALQAIFWAGFLAIDANFCPMLVTLQRSSAEGDTFILTNSKCILLLHWLSNWPRTIKHQLSLSKHERSWNSRATYDRRGSNPCITDHIRVCEGKAPTRKSNYWHIASSYGFLHQHFPGFASQDIHQAICTKPLSLHQQCQRPSKLTCMFVFPPHSHCHI